MCVFITAGPITKLKKLSRGWVIEVLFFFGIQAHIGSKTESKFKDYRERGESRARAQHLSMIFSSRVSKTKLSRFAWRGP